MKISELTSELCCLKEKHGDIPVYYASLSRGSYFGYEVGQAQYEDVDHPDYDDNALDTEITSAGILLA